MIIDTERTPDEFKLNTKASIHTVPATKIALEVIGRAIQNTTLLGYFAAVTELISFEGVKKAIEHRFPAAIAMKNVAAVERAFALVREEAHV